jgi:dihydroorotase
MSILIRGGRVIDPGRLDRSGDLLLQDGRIARIAAPGEIAAADRVVEAAGLVVAPGLIDLHVHLREPGHEYKETIASGCRAAAAGGFTALCAMPNTLPVNDCQEVTRFVLERAAAAGGARVYPAGAVSKGQQGRQLCEFDELLAAGARALSDDGRPVVSSLLMRRALEYAAHLGLPLISHCEETALSQGGAMNEGPVATRLGLPGIPNAAESITVLRDIALCELTGAPLHIAHVSTAQSVGAVADAKARGLPVSAETAPHYFTLTDEAVGDYDTHAKMNPPLRSAADRQAVRRGLADGTLDAIATDHAPHAETEKRVEFDQAANGIIGLETALALGLRLVAEGVLSLETLIARLSTGPARILGLPSGIAAGQPADLTLIDPHLDWTYRAVEGFSLSRNTPFEGWAMRGRAVMTIVGGRVVWELGAK